MREKCETPFNVPSFFIRSEVAIRRKWTKISSLRLFPPNFVSLTLHLLLYHVYTSETVYISKCKIPREEGSFYFFFFFFFISRYRRNLIRNKDKISKKFV